MQGLGSGVIIDSEKGYIVTNNHVVEDADELKITMGDRREFDGKVVGTDPQTDIAVVKIEGKNLPSAKLGDSDTIRVGQWAIAIGNPFGLSQTVSIGVISATGRANVGVAQYEDMIQTDAAINPGNSGRTSSTYGERLLVSIPLYLPEVVVIKVSDLLSLSIW